MHLAFPPRSTSPIGHDETEIAGAGVIDTGVVDFVEDAMAQREPDPALSADRGPDAAFRTRRPAGGYAGPARCERLRLFSSEREFFCERRFCNHNSITNQIVQRWKGVIAPHRRRAAMSYLTCSVAFIVGWKVQT